MFTTNLIIGILALLGMIAYDWLHQKSAYVFTSNILKYAVALSGIFAFSFIIKTRWWQYIQIAGLVVLIWTCWGIIASTITSIKNWFTGAFKR